MHKKYPLLSVIIPVYREEKAINGTIADLFLKAGAYGLEIIAVDGAQNGGTIKKIKNRGIKKIKSEKGRAKQMNAGAAKAGGDILVFVHGDTIMPDNFPALIEQAVCADGYGAGAFEFEFDEHGPLLKAMSLFSSMRSRITHEPFGDQAIFIKKDVFEKIKGYPDIPIMEDIALMRKLKKSCEKITILANKVITSARKVKQEGAVFFALRNWFIRQLYNLGVRPERLALMYYGDYYEK